MTTPSFDVLRDRILVRYLIYALSDVHIGARESLIPGDVDNPVLKSADGTPIVPGSSLKGVLRQETIRLLAGLGFRKNHNVDGDKREDLKMVPKDIRGAADFVHTYLFGSTERASSIRFRDAVATSRRTFIRDGVAIDIQTRKALPKRKYDVEVVPRGTVFDGWLTIENSDIDKYEGAKLGALLKTVEFFNLTVRSLGGYTSRGFGEVLLIPYRIERYTPQHYREGKRGDVYFDPDVKDPDVLNSVKELCEKRGLPWESSPHKWIDKAMASWMEFVLKECDTDGE